MVETQVNIVSDIIMSGSLLLFFVGTISEDNYNEELWKLG